LQGRVAGEAEADFETCHMRASLPLGYAILFHAKGAKIFKSAVFEALSHSRIGVGDI
jgi:hypothetical protein